jgi:predicted RNA-binding Zn ribbon-like protein
VQCLELVNTVEPRIGPVRRDALTSYDALLDWAAPPEPAGTGLRRAAHADPAAAGRALRSAIELREALFELFAALARHRPPPAPASEVLRRHYLAACRASTWDIAPGRTEWHWPADELRQLGWRIAVEAVALVAGPVAVKQCPPEHGGCGWLFVDRTKNGSRRWCSMADCGNTSKARRLTAKRKAARSARA